MSRALPLLWLACVLGWVGARPSRAQDTTPPGLVLDGDVREWAGVTPALALLPRSPAARAGTVWVGQAGAGIVVAGTVGGGAPRWPRSAGEMAQSDHIEIWVTDASVPELPPVGWGNQFGYVYLPDEAACAHPALDLRVDTSTAAVAACRSWYRKQVRHRAALRKLLMRQWQVAPGVAVEVYASPAFAGFDSTARPRVAALDPAGPVPVGKVAAGAGGQGYSFEYLVPWEALPPVQALRLAELRILVDVFSPGTAPLRYGPYSTTAPSRRFGDPATFPLVRLPAARSYVRTPCDDQGPPVVQNGPRTAYLVPSDSALVYYRPGAQLDLRRAVVLDNQAAGYQYQVSPQSLAPVALVGQYWTRDLGQGELLCGPHLGWRHEGTISRSKIIVDLPDYLDSRRLPGGDVLVRLGPRVFGTYFGSGQCGACPRVALDVFYLDRQRGEITVAFSWLDIAEVDSRELDVTLSADWTTIQVYEGATEYPADPAAGAIRTTWNETTHCFRPDKRRFEECGKRQGVPPPSPRSLDLQLNDNR